jgi:RNA polymerase sigma-70 factor (ECF subfamily)
VPLDDRLIDDASNVERAVQWRLTKSRLAAAMTELTEDQRQVIILRFIEGMSCKEAGLMLDKSTGAVKALQHRGLAALARILGSEAL